MVEEEDTCTCAGTITAQSVFLNDQGNPFITSLTDAIAAAPPGCVLKSPTPEELAPTGFAGTSVVVPVVRDPVLTNSCIANDSSATGCRSNWVFPDGSLLPNTAALRNGAYPTEGVVCMDTTGLYNTIVADPASPAYTAFYSCCVEADCIEFTEIAPTPAPTKDKSRRL